ncbi:hypothetical protein FHS95_001232 [Sphingomonas naasensis]|uniref:DoxX family protein n=1 Tax=Sphingomonas naasensis TaxID=1344951 RepID=A0A4S1W8R5_9SPHN|nr:hypothetical protein [Sphingomonas naasensis]NIJ19563.1 hypothetical protein [Sphingomonas naasensis]TGX39294.1 hypothetical protein E5A74_17420 [Sphingomonas naasensis]
MKQRPNYQARIVLAIYMACFSIGALSHARDFHARGWRPYAWGPPLLEAFWTSLLILDALVVVLIASGRRRAGLTLAVAVMITDVSANIFAWLSLGVPDLAIALLLQTALLGFVLGSIPFLWSTDPVPA